MKLLTNIFYGIFILLLLGVAALFMASSLPIQNNLELKIVESGSMEPSIMTGALVIVAPAKEYKLGEVITFSSATTKIPTTHRIAGMEMVDGKILYTTKGDANEEADNAKIFGSNIIGKVYLDVPYAGFILDFARQPLGFAFLIGLPALMIILGEISKIWSEWRRMRQGKIVIKENIFIPKVVTKNPAPPTPKLMLDIATPVRFKFYEADYLLIPEPAFNQRPLRNYRVMTLAIVATLILTAIGIINFNFVTSTLSFSQDIELSTQNSFIARELDFTVTDQGNSFQFNSNDVVAVTVIAPTPESGSLKYNVAVQEIFGPSILCDALETEFINPFGYNGPLLSLSGSDIEFTENWNLPVTLNGNIEDFKDSECVIDLVFTARHTDAELGIGYTDEERVTLTFTVPPPYVPLELDEAFSTFVALPDESLDEEVIEVPEPEEIKEIPEVEELPEVEETEIKQESKVEEIPEIEEVEEVEETE